MIKTILIIILLILVGVLLFLLLQKKEEEKLPIGIIKPILMEEEIKTTKDGVKYLVDPEKLLSGGPNKDGIPSIDNPKFVLQSEVDWIRDDELVLALTYKGVEKIYPLQVMVWHEIINDIVAGDALLITYCPLCGTGIAFKRVLDGEDVEFGVSGKLFNSNLVMYDRKTDSYWTQVGGKAIIGEKTGQKLEQISIDTVVYREWKKEHKDSLVLSKETGFDRPYGNDPYGNYYEDSFLLFPVENQDDRVHPKTIVFGIKKDDKFIAYKEVDVKKLETLTDKENKVELKYQNDGTVKIIDTENGKEIIKETGMWFAWYAFHPQTQLYMVK